MNIYIITAVVIAGTTLACALCGCSGKIKYDHGDQHAEIDWQAPTSQPASTDRTPIDPPTPR